MKKIIIVLFFLTLICLSKQQATANVLLPENSVRFRIIANSDSFADQTKKIAIKEQIENDVFKNLKAENINEFREEIKKNMPKIEQILKNSEIDYQINYGDNYFPIKDFKGVKYDAGMYESLVITLGKGQGHNWWCVLFPPLCLLETEDNNLDDVEYKSYVQEILTKYL